MKLGYGYVRLNSKVYLYEQIVLWRVNLVSKVAPSRWVYVQYWIPTRHNPFMLESSTNENVWMYFGRFTRRLHPSIAGSIVVEDILEEWHQYGYPFSFR